METSMVLQANIIPIISINEKEFKIPWLFPIVVAKTLSQICWLKKHKCIVSHFCTSEVLQCFHWAKGKAVPCDSSEGRMFLFVFSAF